TGASTLEAARNAAADYASASAEGGAAAGDVKAAQSQIDELQRLMSQSKVNAPFDGVVNVLKQVEDGAVAHKGRPVARGVHPSQLEVKFAVPHADKDLVRPGDTIDVELDKGPHTHAVVKKVSDDHDPNVDFFIAEAEFDASTIRAGEIHVGAGGHVR